MKQQSSIFDQAERAKQDGIELVYRHANTTWKRRAATKLHEVIQSKRYFTSEDIIVPLEKEGIVTKDNRAISAVLQAFSRAQLITSTDRFTQSRRRSRHHAPIRVWESNLSIRKEAE